MFEKHWYVIGISAACYKVNFYENFYRYEMEMGMVQSTEWMRKLNGLEYGFLNRASLKYKLTKKC